MPELPIILASGSEIRKSILEESNISFSIIKPSVDEEEIKSSFKSEDFSERARILAKAKAREVSSNHLNSLVIGADQICVLGSKTYSKPGNFKKAVRNLTELSGNLHRQYSGICLYRDGELLWEHSEFAELKMKYLSQEEIKAYIKLDDPLQCCGCYKFESNGSDLFEYVKGSENVIKGLALEALLEALDKYN